MHVEIVGLETVLDAVNNFGKQIEKAAVASARDEAEFEFELTQELVPVAEGQLKASGRVEPVEFNGHEIAAAIAYGGPAGAGRNTKDVDYAEKVHEDLEAHHENGQAKYVEAVVNSEFASGATAERMAAGIIERLP